MRDLFVPLFTLLLLLTASAFFSAAESSCSSITGSRLRTLKRNRDKKSRKLLTILSQPKRLLSTLLMGNNLVNIWASSLATAVAIMLFGQKGLGLATVAMTVLILIFSEITPKSLALIHPLRTALFLTPLIGAVRTIFYPATLTLSFLTRFMDFLIERLLPGKANAVTEDELKTMIRVGRSEGILEESEHDLLSKAFDFTDLRIREIMTPRTGIYAISADATFEEMLASFRQHQYSRMPIFEGRVDKIIGMIHYKDILFCRETGADFSLDSILRPVCFVPESQTAFRLLQVLKAQELNMAIVIDEHGGTDGLVTMDDAISAVFGGIHDEYDAGEISPLDAVRFIHRNRIQIPGSLKLSQFNELLKSSLHSDYYETIAGLLMEKCGRLPATGTSIDISPFTFKILEVKRRKILTIDVQIAT